MRVAALTWRRYRVPLVAGFETAHGPLSLREGLLLTLTGDDGVVGLGEAAPLPGFGGSVDDAAAMLRRLGPESTGRDLGELPGMLAGMEPARAGVAAVRCALDAAALDLLGRARGVPAACLLSERVGSAIAVNATIGAAALDDAVSAAAAARARGFGAVKLKVGVREALAAEVERVAAVRAAVGDEVRLRLDVNGAWDVEHALAVMRELREFAIELVEQPVAADDLEGLRRVRAAGLIPVAADEAVSSLAAARRVLAAEAADALVIKPMAVGGARAGLAIARLAAIRGVETIVTSMIDSGVGIMLALQLAAALPGRRSADGLATAALLADDLVDDLPPVVDGVMALPQRPGLGVTLDDAALHRFAGPVSS